LCLKDARDAAIPCSAAALAGTSRPAGMRLTCCPGIRQGASREAAQLQPGAMHSLDVSLVAPGAWQVVCRTANHYADGMTAIIDVASNGARSALARVQLRRRSLSAARA